MPIAKLHQDYIELTVWVKPGASRNAVLDVTERGLAIAVCAKPQAGEANLAVCQLLADFLRVPKSAVKVLKGQQGRQKIIQVPRSDEILKKIQHLI